LNHLFSLSYFIKTHNISDQQECSHLFPYDLGDQFLSRIVSPPFVLTKFNDHVGNEALLVIDTVDKLKCKQTNLDEEID